MMHIYFSGIGGAGIGPLAMIATQAGYTVSGSDKQASQYTDYLQKHGIQLHIGQTYEQIEAIHTAQPIDWIVYSSAVAIEQHDSAELRFATEHGIRTSKRDECLNAILRDKQLRLIAIAGTHGKTTTTAMVIWLFKQLGIPVSYSVGAKLSFGDMGHFDPASSYFVYECDEFDRNFLAFSPHVSILTAVDWDHQDVFETRDSYKEAFRTFIAQSAAVTLHESDAAYLGVAGDARVHTVGSEDPLLQQISLPGEHNRRNATVAIRGTLQILDSKEEALVAAINAFPGTSRRIEQIAPGIYSDYAHTPEEVRATLQLASEISSNVMAVYEPLTNRRQHYAKELYGNCFKGVTKLLWLPSYMAREDPSMHVYSPSELIAYLPADTPAEVAEMGADLRASIEAHVQSGGIVVCMAGGGGGSLDEWLRATFG